MSKSAPVSPVAAEPGAAQEQARTTAGHLEPERWVEEHGDAMFSYAMLHLRDTEVAEELVQDTFVAALANADGYQGRASERSWLISILKHKIIDHIRRVSRRREYWADLEDDAAETSAFRDDGHFSSPVREWIDNPQQALQQKEFYRVFTACLQGLPEKLNTVFTLRELDQLSTEEICKLLDITSTNLWVMLHRARLRLRRCMEARWLDTEPGSGA
ncbi:MAG: sigma-70 family RNA polymerase sigma factor [Bdellovibrionales bacterium]|nr:sigma-70 family RNA polymerase sigma factor [Bdellovibrionales bacterium]